MPFRFPKPLAYPMLSRASVEPCGAGLPVAFSSVPAGSGRPDAPCCLAEKRTLVVGKYTKKSFYKKKKTLNLFNFLRKMKGKVMWDGKNRGKRRKEMAEKRGGKKGSGKVK